jgi:hypothetical protein
MITSFNNKEPLISNKKKDNFIIFPENGISSASFTNIFVGSSPQYKTKDLKFSNLNVKTFTVCEIFKQDLIRIVIIFLMVSSIIIHFLFSLGHWIGNIIFMIYFSDCILLNLWRSVILWDTIVEGLFGIISFLIVVIFAVLVVWNFIKKNKGTGWNWTLITLLVIIIISLGLIAKHIGFIIWFIVKYNICYLYPLIMSGIQFVLLAAIFVVFGVIGLLMLSCSWGKTSIAVSKLSQNARKLINSDVESEEYKKLSENPEIQKEVVNLYNYLFDSNPFTQIFLDDEHVYENKKVTEQVIKKNIVMSSNFYKKT